MTTPLMWFRKKRVWIPLAIYAAYAVFGFLILPGILRGQIVQGIRQNMKREARLAKVRVNPIILSLTLEGFELKDPDGTPFVAFDRLYMDYQVSSLVRWALTFRKFQIDGPKVNARLMPDGSMNFADMIPKQEGKPPRLIIGSFQINRGSMGVTNLMNSPPEQGTLAPLDLTLERFTTIPEKEGVYHIVATDPGGGAWEWRGDLTFEPMHSAGELEISGSQLRRFWEIAKHRVGFEIMDGRLGCRLKYTVDARGDSLVARVEDSRFTVAGLTLREKGTEPDLLKLDSLAITGVEVRYPQQTLAVDRVLVVGTQVRAWLNPDTTLNWLAVMTPPASQPRPTAAPRAAVSAPPETTGTRSDSVKATAPAPDWTVTFGEVAIRDLGLDLEDRTTQPTFELSVTPVNAIIKNISSRPGAAFEIQTDLTIAGKGRFEASGLVTAQPPAADLEIHLANLPLKIFQPYVNPVAKLQLVSGTLGVKGAVHFRQNSNTPDVRFVGNVVSHGFLTRDRIDNEPFLAWKSVEVNAIDYAPSRISIGSARITDPFSKLLIHKDRTTNVQDILGIPTLDSTAVVPPAAEETGKKQKKGKQETKAQPKTSEALAAMQRSAQAAAAPMPVKIGTVEVVNGSADFADLSLILPFAARIENLGGTVKGLSSDSTSRAVVALDGKLVPTGTTQVRGEINPLAKDVLLDLKVVFRDFNMPGLTPYAGQFLGREIDKGRMHLDLGYRLQGRHLVGENKVVMEELELGTKVESPEATHMPVGLAIAILKDKDGKIDLDVPVEGDLDDPKFRIWKVIWSFIMHLLTKVATAPFALLGSLFGGGGGDELGHVDFEVGAATVPTDQQETLSKLAEALGNRPQLSLEIRGRSDADSDAVAIRRAKFAAKAAERMTSDPKKYGTSLGYSRRLLDDLCVERLGKKGFAALQGHFQSAAGELDPSNPDYKKGSRKIVLNEPAFYAAVPETLIAREQVNEADLLLLANGRATAIKTDLVALGVEEPRVFLLDPEPGKVERGRVRVELALNAQ